MRPQERRVLRRLMIVASLLVAVMVAVTLWLAFEGAGRPPPSSTTDTGASSGPSGPP